MGHPWFITEVRVVDDEGQPVAPGEPGELFSRSPYLMNGYLNDPEATAACTTDDGFLTCGDVVIVDDEGFIRIVDRKKDMIIRGGVNVYPRDVEEAVLTFPRSSGRWPWSGCRTRRGASRSSPTSSPRPARTSSAEALDAHLRGTLAAYKIPRDVVDGRGAPPQRQRQGAQARPARPPTPAEPDRRRTTIADLLAERSDLGTLTESRSAPSERGTRPGRSDRATPRRTDPRG